MKGNEGVIALLNEVLKGELTAINQYFLHAEMCENWGYMKLASYGRKESIDEMKHAETLIEPPRPAVKPCWRDSSRIMPAPSRVPS